MANNNVQNVKFLRNGVVFVPGNDKTARQVALDAMESQKANLADGTAILGRYQETNGIVKTLVGFAYISGDTKTLTVFDVDGAGADVDAKIAAAINALDAEKTSSDGKNVQVKVTEVDGVITAVNITTDNTVNSGDVDAAITNAINELDGSVIAETGYFVKSVTEADGKISGTTEALPTVAAISEAGKPITAVSESLGAISATAGTINAQYVNINDAGGIITATNVEDALAEIAAEIDGMDLAVVSGDGEVITAVSEEDGKVSASKTAIKDVKLTGYAKNTTATGAISATDDIEDALSKLENTIGSNAISNADGSITVTPTNGSTTDVKVHIKSGENVIKLDGEGGGIYTNLDLVEITESLPADVKVRYELRDSDNVKIGDSIDIPKDSHIVSITFQDDPKEEHYQNLIYTYIDVSGATQVAYVDISELVLEAEFASGITITNHVAHGVVDPASENFLTVGAAGFKLDGVKNAIDSAIDALDATGGTQTIATGKHVAVEVAEVNGKITTVTVVEDNIADADDLAALSAKTVTEIVSSNASISAVSSSTADGTVKYDVVTDASKIKMSGFTSTDALSGINATSSVTEAFKEVDKVITDNEKVVSTALNDLNSRIDNLDAVVSGETTDGKVNVKVTETNGAITAVDVVGTDIASDSALTAEITARKAVDGQNGQTYSANTTANYINDATSLNDADVKLDAALKAADDAMLTGVEAGNGITVSGKANKSQTISAKVNGDGGIVNDSAGLHLGTIDCGTY